MEEKNIQSTSNRIARLFVSWLFVQTLLFGFVGWYVAYAVLLANGEVSFNSGDAFTPRTR